MQLIMSLVGVVTIFVLAFLLSANRAAINRRTLLIAFSLQAAVAAFVLYVPVGGRFLDRVVVLDLRDLFVVGADQPQQRVRGVAE